MTTEYGVGSRASARLRLGSSALLRIYFVEWVRMTMGGRTEVLMATGYLPANLTKSEKMEPRPCQRLQGQAQRPAGMTETRSIPDDERRE